jgi:hypothetical protein
MTENPQSAPDYSILAAFDRGIVRPRTSFFYLCGLLLVTVTMVILPLIYLAFVGAVALLVGYHAIHDWGPIMGFGESEGSGPIILKFLLYFTPLAAGGVVLFFLFKPLFARRRKQAQPLALNPATEPLLYAFIQKICDTVGAPAPKRIDLDCQLNASAGLRRGFLSFFGHDLVLTVGLPLVAGLTVEEFAGVVAHEFGHFTQGAAMRLSYIIRRVNFWFARVVYERDAWDAGLERWSMNVRDWRVAIVVWTAHLGVALSRLILRVLMLAGNLICGFMLRQMEYDADAYEIKVAGSEAFETTQRKLATLDATLNHTYQKLRVNWKKYRTLPDNLPEVLRHEHATLPANTQQQINDTLGLRGTRLFDSHPSPGDRIRRARKAGDPGIFHDDRPASRLFASFDHPARFVTLLHYTHNLGVPVKPAMLTPVQTEAGAGAPSVAAAQTAGNEREDFFFGVLPLLLPLRLSTPAVSSNWEAELAEWQQLSDGLRQLAPQLASVGQQHAQATRKLLHARAARWLISGGVAVDPALLDSVEPTLEAVKAAEENAEAARKGLQASLHEVAPTLVRRLELALSLSLSTSVEPGQEAASAAQMAEVVAALNADAESYPRWRELGEALAVLHQVTSNAAARKSSPVLTRALERQMQAAFSLYAQITATPEVQPANQPTEPRLRIAGKPGGSAEG